jgi:dipeptidase
MSRRFDFRFLKIAAGPALLMAFLWGGPRLAAPSAGPDAQGVEAPGPEGCTVIMVGKNASTDGSVMTTHTCDNGVTDWTWRRISAADHKPGEMRRIHHINCWNAWPPEQGLKWDRAFIDGATDVEIPQVRHTYGYFVGNFGYMNDVQLSIGESTIGSRAKLENMTAAPQLDITMLTILAMERCATAREAIRFMGGIAEKYGYGFTDFGEMLAVADPKEVWVFEIMPVGPLWTPESGKPGCVWAAQRVPDDHVAICPNESRIGEMNLSDKDNFLASPNAVSLAVEQKWFDPQGGRPFNWRRAYWDREGSALSTQGGRVRLWRFFNLVAPSLKIGPETSNLDYPLTVKPEKKLSVRDVMALTRDKCEGTIFDPARGLQGGPFSNPNFLPSGFEVDGRKYGTTRGISVNRAEYVTVTQARGWLPDPIGGIVWLAWGAQDTSCFFPLYTGIAEIPRSFEIGDHWIVDRKSARWAFDYVESMCNIAYAPAIAVVREERKKWELPLIERTPMIDQNALDLYKKDPAAAKAFLTDYCLTNANAVVDRWWKLGDELLVMVNHLWLYDGKTRSNKLLPYPDWYLRLMIEQGGLKPLEEKK